MFPQIRTARWIGSSLCLALTGCTGMKRVDLGPKTIPSVGDRQISVTAGRPGEEIIRTETATPKFDVREARRISGRVIDHRGQPISGATVRMADGALATGQISDVITDEAGGFTVRGLRASTPYTLIATLDLGSETRISRARFVSGETQARIVLEPTDADPADREPVAAGSTRRAERPVVTAERPAVSVERTVVTSAETAQSPNRLPMPPKGRWIFVDESDQVVANVPTRSADADVKRASSRRPVEDDRDDENQATPAPKKKPVNAEWRSAETTSARPTRDSGIRLASFDSDEENPLPPARERKAFVYEEFDEEPAQPERRRLATGTPENSPGPLPEELVPVTPSPEREDLAASEDEPRSRAVRSEPTRRSTPVRRSSGFYSDAPSAGSLRVEDIEEVNRMIRERRAQEQDLTDPGVRADEDSRDPSKWEDVARPVRIESAPRTDRTINRTVRSTEPLAPPADLPEISDSKRSSRDSDLSPGRSLERSFSQRESIERSLKSAYAPTSNMSRSDEVVARTEQERIDRLKAAESDKSTAFNGETPRSANEWINRFSASLPWTRKATAAVDSSVSGAFCDFDPENQRIVDFELTDIKGRSTRFSQIPSDLTLIVFWGTWCKPCHEAMPQLVELQKRLESDGVQILGIAYEEGTSQERQDKVAAAVERYDINFPILLGGSQGAETCPVRKSLGVRVYPTLVLVDRAGRVLWRDQGVTQATFRRLDRVMAAHLQELDRQQLADSTAPVRR